MCGRFRQDPERLARVLPTAPRALLVDYEVRPGRVACVLGAHGPRSAVFGMRAAWQDPAAPRLYNARSETVARKPTWRNALRSGRIAVPVTEWQERGPGERLVPVVVETAVAWLPAIGDETGFAILTCAPCAQLAAVHHRSPAFLTPEGRDRWIEARDPGEALSAVLREPVGTRLTTE